ncbi:MAG: hypothetical protein GTO51_05325 [Candidatus Latescibacteria bacterium]|nr:hypothetical protein [Candidatus Latescibacterota bacterium]NIO28424.1 hypothetical protein [Candidatus Latescibacterota bacterium]NIO55973.1 hypothetical protein [Candidatus Latescibacterota bacterium]NIT01937.1 hypothetical protein [Candidatus Latescibacterota bacterium]
MKEHVTILGAFYIAFNVQGILAAMIVLLAVGGGGIISGDPTAIAITSTVAASIATLLLVLSAPGIIGGIGLIKQKPWARILVLILGCLNLLIIPFGTILGIYTLWVLSRDETVELFSSQPDAGSAEK